MISFKPDSNEKYLQDLHNYLFFKKWKVKSYKAQRNISWLNPTQKLAILRHYLLKYHILMKTKIIINLIYYTCQLANEIQKKKFKKTKKNFINSYYTKSKRE